MRGKLIWASWPATAIFLVSCGLPAYAPVTERHVIQSPENFSVDLPQGWRQHNLAYDPLHGYRAILEKRRKLSWDVIRLTRDGLLLQQICIGRIPVTDELPNTKRKLSQEMIPLEAADVISSDIRSNSNLRNQDIIENVPSMVGGYPGFKLRYTYRTEDELKVEGLFYGALVGNWLYYMLYEAPAQHYFAKDVQLFEDTRSSFAILKGAGEK
jgi:hypothetical protein